MRIFLALVVGIAIGAAAVWYYAGQREDPSLRAAGQQAGEAARAAGDSLQSRLRALKLGTNDIKDELAHTGQVIRKKANEAGKAIADATADARTTTAIKAKLVGSRDLSAMSISVNTTDGVVTLSGAVNSPEDVSKAMLLALETEGVREVISTLQIKPKQKQPQERG